MKKIFLLGFLLIIYSYTFSYGTSNVNSKNISKIVFKVEIPLFENQELYTEKFQIETQKNLDKILKEKGLKEYYQIFDIKENNFNIISIIFMNSVYYNKAAHFINTFSSYNIDKKTGKFLTNDDILSKELKKRYFEEIKNAIKSKKNIKNYQGENIELFEFKSLSLDSELKNTVIFFEGDYICFLYQNYDLAPYAMGNPCFKFLYKK